MLTTEHMSMFVVKSIHNQVMNLSITVNTIIFCRKRQSHEHRRCRVNVSQGFIDVAYGQLKVTDK